MVKRWPLIALALSSLLLGGCASLLEAPGQVTVTVESVQASAPPGGELSATVRIAPANFTGSAVLTLEGPAGFTLLEPTTPVSVNGPTTARVRVRVEPSTPAGNYTLNFRLQPQGLPPVPLTWNVWVTGQDEGGTALQPVRVQGPGEEVRLVQGQRGQFSLSVFNPNRVEVAVEAYVAETSGAATVTPGFQTQSLMGGERRDLAFSLSANAPTEGQVVLEVRTLAESRIVARENVRVRYRVEAAGVGFQASPALGGISEEPYPNPRTTVSYEARNFEGLMVLEALTPGWEISPNVITVRQGGGQFQLSLLPPANIAPGNYSVGVKAFRDGYETRFEIPVEMRSFTLRLDENRVTAAPEATLRGSVTPEGSLTGNVTFSLEGPNASLFALAPSSVAPGPFSLQIIPTRSAAPGIYNLTLRANLGGIVKRASFQIEVQGQGYSASLLPASLDGYTGQTVQTMLRIQTVGGFSGQLTLAVKDALTNTFIPWLSVNPATVQVSGPAEIPVTLAIGQGAPLGTKNLKLLLFGNQNAEVDFVLNVRQPTFHITLNQTSFTVPQGGSATATLSVSTEGGFTGQINLSLTGPGSNQFTLAPSAVNTDAATWGLVITASPSAAAGTYSLVLNAASGSVQRQIPITITVP